MVMMNATTARRCPGPKNASKKCSDTVWNSSSSNLHTLSQKQKQKINNVLNPEPEPAIFKATIQCKVLTMSPSLVAQEYVTGT